MTRYTIALLVLVTALLFVFASTALASPQVGGYHAPKDPQVGGY